MVKISQLFFKLLLIFGIISTTYANYSKIDSYSYQIRNGSKTNSKKAYHNLKNLYLSSIINSNKALEERALRALIAGGRRLGEDVSRYEQELKDKFLVVNKQSINEKVIVHKPTVMTADLNTIKKTKLHEDKIDIYFTNKINSKEINHFTLTGSTPYRYIYDIEAKLYGESQEITLKSGVVLKIGQYKENILRIVASSNKKIDPSFITSNNVLTINFNSEIKITSNTATNKLIEKSTPPINDKIIVIDAGHGGHDTGAVGDKRHYEKDLVLDVSLKVFKKLSQKGYKVYLTREVDKYIKLSDRTKYANRRKADIFVSIHANSVAKKSRQKEVTGIETYFLSTAKSDKAKNVAAIENENDIEAMNFQSKQTYLNVFNNTRMIQSNKLAIDIQKNMFISLKNRYNGIRDGGVREGPFWVLVGAQMPSVLIEVGYISNPTEMQRLFTNKYQDILTDGIVNGIESYFIKN